MKTYFAARDSTFALVTADGSLSAVRLNPRNDLRDHSPTGFAWGYGGSGPSQLALALLADALGDDQRALAIYQDFKWLTVARWSRFEGWSITDEKIIDAVAGIDARRKVKT